MLNVYANILPLNNIQRILASLQVFVELTKYVPREGIVMRILSHTERREGFAARFLSLPGGGKGKTRVSCSKPLGGKLETLFLGPNHSAARYRGAILAPRGAAGRNCRTILVSPERRQAGDNEQSCPTRIVARV